MRWKPLICLYYYVRQAGEAKRGVERKLEEALEAADESKKEAQSQVSYT